jgi:hypothetical protein
MGYLSRYLDRRYQPYAYGAAIFVKPFLALVTLVDFRGGERRKALLSLAVAAGLGLLSLLLVGLPAHVEYVRFMSTLAASQTAFAGNQSLLAGVLRIATDWPVLDYGFAQDAAWMVVSRLLALVVLAAAGFAHWRAARETAPMLSMGLWLSAALLALSISWEHHLVFLLPVVAFLWTLRLTGGQRGTLAAATILMALYWTPLYGDTGIGRVFASFPLMGNLLLFGLLFVLHRRPRGAVQADPLASES